MRVIPIDVPELGNRSYLIVEGQSAVVIDPSRRTHEIVAEAKKANVTIRAIFETHIHNDYITGGYDLARKLGIPYYVSSRDLVPFKRHAIDSEQTITINGLHITALATPGHTHNHLGYLVTAADGQTTFFSGGSLLYGAVGRTDLISEQDTMKLAKAQYRTAQFLRTRLDEATELYPTHGFGSFCAATETEHVSVSTLAQQFKVNPAYITHDEAQFAKELMQGLDVYPAYYTYMGPLNTAGPLRPMLEPPARLTREAVLSALHTGVAVVDMRNRIEFASRHVSGTYNIELGSDLATYIGWLIAWEAPLIVVAGSPEEVSIAQEQLSLIGRELTGGQITAKKLLAGQTVSTSYPVCTFKDLADTPADQGSIILDVRRKLEWQKSHLPNALHIPLHELQARMHELNSDKLIWVYCTSGFRASIAASMLDAASKQPILVNDSFTNAAKAGLLPIQRLAYVDEVGDGKAQLVDVRDTGEWKVGHAVQAVHLPLGMLLEGDVSGLDESKPVYLYCDSGERSGMAEDYLNELGFAATNIGGLSDWIQAGGTHE